MKNRMDTGLNQAPVAAEKDNGRRQRQLGNELLRRKNAKKGRMGMEEMQNKNNITETQTTVFTHPERL